MFFRIDMAGVPELTMHLSEAVAAAMADPEPDNPIYRAMESFALREIGAADPDRIIAARLDTIERLVGRIAMVGPTAIRRPGSELALAQSYVVGDPTMVKELGRRLRDTVPAGRLEYEVDSVGERSSILTLKGSQKWLPSPDPVQKVAKVLAATSDLDVRSTRVLDLPMHDALGSDREP